MKVFSEILFLCLLLISHAWSAENNLPKNGVLKKIEWDNGADHKRFGGYFRELINRPFEPLTFKIQSDLIAKELFNSGYFNSTIKTNTAALGNDVVATISIDFKVRSNFEFTGNTIFTHQDLRSKLTDKIKNELGKAEINTYPTYLEKIYEDAGFYNTKVTLYSQEGLDLEKKKIVNYFFNIKEGKKLKVQSLTFRGNFFLKNERIEEIFYKDATVLASGKFYDPVYYEEFSNILKKEYLSRGFVFVEISKPRVVFNDLDKTVSIEYGIAEKQQVFVRSIMLKNVSEDLQVEAKRSLINREGDPVNIIELENDLRKLVVSFQNQGYYFASITNLNSKNLISYDKSYAYVDISPEITLDKKVCFNQFIINGNVETKTEVIAREIDLAPGELITPAKIETIRQKLSGLNLFSSLRLTPYMIYEAESVSVDCPKTNLVIQVKEKDFGLIEVAPGFRTDIGAKLSTGITYNNLSGMNRSASLRLQGNRRVNPDGLDERRKSENKDLIEYSAKASFLEPYLFYNILKTQVELELSSTFQRVRYSKFDADILRLSPQFSKTFSRWLSTSIRYQFERIVQFDATTLKDNDNFSIGGITPSITLDFRDDIINPKKGAFFNLSSEWANSNFGSMKLADLEVNFIKVISRNRFYYPVGNFVIALSVAGGYQKNFADEVLKDSFGNPVVFTEGFDKGKSKTKGYIPSIKVFRLDGYDEIRGYDDTEINRLMNGVPVGDVVVQKEAYFTAIKVEPRYSLTDNLKLGVFFDAGRVFVNDFQPFKLRSSVGAGLKYVTPVGSLDFDYGIKLQRKSNADGSRDSMGRFHLSIGFF